MYEVHLEWQTRVCPVGVASLARQFRRYFDRFEGRIREPPYAVYDDLAYTQGSPPTVLRSPTLEHDIGSAGGIMTGPNLEEYRERLRGFALDLGKPDDLMQNVFPSNEHQHDIGDLYNFGTTPRNQSSLAPGIQFTDANKLDESVFSSLEPFTISDHQPFQTNDQSYSGNGTQGLSPFELASITSSHHSGQAPMSDEIGLLFDETDIDMLENDLFGDMPDMPGLDGIIDQNFLDFLDTQQ